ncbi:hypothetical protein SDRG_07200 [Saprolegnia diclina VS20]|uniref:Uncharacterized protein n=1 Tax=Saprolegnia diclina (strain VS20) TaxID=1156394 RepID=T0RYY2_SAPDV|nr:hypothetical protein SDRG_07200 [Saprolegnia diclina VS20]EQC35492.1 hypothetical protein SDRG_07200 [Saprolegnia diclina VS20]|eukprot:XP_008611242.1 hypothetical protein SDRG_07200 [Saprolegnia diclina VS20]
MTAVRQHETELQVVLEYFRLFRHGCPVATREIHAFLHTYMHSDVRLRGQTGHDALLQLWRFPNAISHGFCMETPAIQAIELGPTVMVRAGITARLRISRTTVTALYPQLLSDEALVQRLVGQEVHLTIVCHLYFDESARVIEIDAQSDNRMTVGLNQLLGSLDDTYRAVA